MRTPLPVPVVPRTGYSGKRGRSPCRVHARFTRDRGVVVKGGGPHLRFKDTCRRERASLCRLYRNSLCQWGLPRLQCVDVRPWSSARPSGRGSPPEAAQPADTSHNRRIFTQPQHYNPESTLRLDASSPPPTHPVGPVRAIDKIDPSPSTPR